MADDPNTATVTTTAKVSFFEAHGTVVLLYSLVIGGAAATFWLGLRHPENAKVFEWATGFCTGAFSALTLAMRVTSAK